MPTHCDVCDRPLVRVAVPSVLREYAPENAAVVGSCPRCLRTYPLASDESSDFDGEAALPAAVPDGEGSAALLLALGLLDSLATNRAAIQALVEHAEASGADVFLTLDRLAADESVEAHADLGRRRRQLVSLLDS
ncbi:DUF6276 family protein [Halobellus litoreus]|uniref:DUF6276 family protein n=1 Tax=Halobellus litoreus TaxID=755310 RepID=A0ABD6DUC5_9EURY|nr:DUF6276 family protein [Halobellus litoreus]